MQFLDRNSLTKKIETVNDNMVSNGMPNSVNTVAFLTRYMFELETYAKALQLENNRLCNLIETISCKACK